MSDIYSHVPQLESENFLFRFVDKKDVNDLLRVYSDECAVRNMNSDNCHGDTFLYQSKERMEQAIDFWISSYQNKSFVRESIVYKKTNIVVGTTELFHRTADDYFTDCGLLRLDLRSDFENTKNIYEIVSALCKTAYNDFDCDKTAIKATNQPRINALVRAGFEKSDNKLIGYDGTEYKDYYVKEKER